MYLGRSANGEPSPPDLEWFFEALPAVRCSHGHLLWAGHETRAFNIRVTRKVHGPVGDAPAPLLSEAHPFERGKASFVEQITEWNDHLRFLGGDGFLIMGSDQISGHYRRLRTLVDPCQQLHGRRMGGDAA
jgi:hypothetical protein